MAPRVTDEDDPLIDAKGLNAGYLQERTIHIQPTSHSDKDKVLL